MIEMIFQDNENTILKEKNLYFKGLLRRKFLYHQNKITTFFEYKYDDQDNCISQKEYDYDTFCKTFFNYRTPKKNRKRKRKKVDLLKND